MTRLSLRDQVKTKLNTEVNNLMENEAVDRGLSHPNLETSTPEAIALFYSRQFSVNKLDH